jgi:succinate dehydrogenase / fumarate reductase cytochrome b subunit
VDRERFSEAGSGVAKAPWHLPQAEIAATAFGIVAPPLAKTDAKDTTTIRGSALRDRVKRFNANFTRGMQFLGALFGIRMLETPVLPRFFHNLGAAAPAQTSASHAAAPSRLKNTPAGVTLLAHCRFFEMASKTSRAIPAPRPLSPHLQIYRWQWTMALSILHRITGVALAVGTLLVVWWLLAAALGPEAYREAQAVLGHWLGQLLLFGWTVALFYHLFNGIRHLLWDAGRGFELRTAHASGIAVLAATALATAITWVAALALR